MESEVLKPGQCRAPSGPSAPSARPDSRCPSWEEEPGSPGNVTGTGTRPPVFQGHDGWVLKRPIFFPGI